MSNLVVLVIEGLQPAYLGPYGNTWVNTPAWNQLAAASLLLERHWLDAPGLADFYRAAWSGQPSWAKSGVLDSGFGIEGEPKQPTPEDAAQACRLATSSLPGALTAAGYRTVLLSDDSMLAELPGADDFEERIELPLDAPTEPAADWTETALARFFAAASDTLDGLSEPFALWLHTGLLGRVWDAPYDYRSRFAEEDDPEPTDLLDPPTGVVPVNVDPDELLGIRQAYAGQIALLDECLAAFLEAWDNDPRSKETWLVVLGARGYPLGEHGRWGWTPGSQTPGDRGHEDVAVEFVGHELLHSVAMIRAPDRARATERAAVLAQPCDLWATVAEVLALPTANAESIAWPTGSWWSAPLFTAEWPARDRLFIATGTEQDQLQTAQWWYAGKGNAEISAKHAEHEHHSNDQTRLYLLPEDYFGVSNVANRCAAEATALAELLAAWQQSRPAQDPKLALQPLPEVLTHAVM
jgi:hypothetical protein